MAYQSHFKHADDIVAHLNGIVPAIADPLLRVKYVGFVTIAATTVYELAIKEIFIEFSSKKHKLFGEYIKGHFDKINGRIKTSHICDDYLSKFGKRYLDRFRKKLDEASKDYLKLHRRDIRSSYANVITWRHDFAHEGRFNTTATYKEAVQAYEDGKEVIRCLAESMQR